MSRLKHSFDYQMNRDEFLCFCEIVPMTVSERIAFSRWTRAGNCIDSNPWGYVDGTDMPMNFLEAYRIRNGYTQGPWDHWHGDESNETFI